MKILHIVENLDNSYGGPSRSVPLLVKYLDKENTENKIFTIQVYDNESNLVLEQNDLGVIKLPLEGMKKIKYSSKLENAIVKEITHDTVIHVHTVWTYPAYVGFKIAKKYNIPLVVSTRGTIYSWALNQRKFIKNIAMWLFQKDMLKTADVIHITEPNEKKALVDINIDGGINNSMMIAGIDLPLLWKVKFNKFYILAGPSFSFDIVQQFDQGNIKRTNPMSFVGGLGFNFDDIDISLNYNGLNQYISDGGDLNTVVTFGKIYFALGFNL